MSEATEKFRQLDAERAEAKLKMQIALGEAKQKEYKGQDASKEWAEVAKYGLAGVEGEKVAAMQALADETVSKHPELFENWKQYINPESHEAVIKMVGLLGKAGLKDEATLLEMFERAHFERQTIGATPQIEMRILGTRGGK